MIAKGNCIACKILRFSLTSVGFSRKTTKIAGTKAIDLETNDLRNGDILISRKP